MQTSKDQILVLLKRTGSATVEGAAGALGIASMTARQHLINLERDGLIVSERVRRPQGRPHYLYKLTEKGEDAFPRRYDLLARALLDEVATMDPGDLAALATADERKALLVQRAADRLAEQFRFDTESRGLEERVQAVTGVLTVIGGLAEWWKTESGYEILDYNCVFASILDENSGCCQGHVRLITQLLKWPVTPEESDYCEAVRCCRYVVSLSSVAQTGEGQTQEGLGANA